MLVKIENWGWNAPLPCTLGIPYYTYLCIARNGIVVQLSSTVKIESGEYELSDEEWSLDNPRWDSEDWERGKIEVEV